jgi:hypothetical protein
LTVSTGDRSVSTLQRLYTLPTVRVKVPKNFEPNHTCVDQTQYHTTEVWLHRDATKPLQRYAEDQQPATVTAAEQIITLPSGQHLSKGFYPTRTGLYSFNSGPLCSFRIRLTDNSTHLINRLSQSHMDCGCTVVGDSPGGPLKQLGKPHLKPAKSQGQTRPT